MEDSGAHVDDFGDDDDCFDSEASYDEDLPEDFGEEDIPEEVFAEIIDRANIVYDIYSRKDTRDVMLAYEAQKKTQSIEALDQSATAG